MWAFRLLHASGVKRHASSICRRPYAKRGVGMAIGKNDNILELVTNRERNQLNEEFARAIRYMSIHAYGNGSCVFEVQTDDDFDALVLQAEKPVMVQFYADWCGPCQNLSPKMEAKVNGQDGKILMARVNVDSMVGHLTEQFDVTSVPTVVCFRDGEIVHRFEGDVGDDYLDEVVTNLKEEEGH